MIVLFATPYFYPLTSGGELTLRSRARALARRGNQVFIRYNRGQPAPPDPEINPSYLPEPSEERFLREVVQEIQPDRLVLSHLSRFDTAVIRKAGPPNMKIIYGPCYWREILINPAVLGEWMEHGQEPLNEAGLRALRAADQIVVNSEFSQEVYRRLGLNSLVAEPDIDLAASLSSNGARDLLGVMGLHRHGTMPYRLAVAMPKHRFRVLDYEGASGRADLRNLPNVECTGWTDRPAEFYSRTKVLIHPSRLYESYGRAVAEALANGIPVICSDRGYSHRMIGNGGFALSVDAPLEDWVRAIMTALENYETMARAARLRGNAVIETSRCPGLVFALLVETAGED